MNIALFPNAEVVDFWAVYKGHLWPDHADGDAIAPGIISVNGYRLGKADMTDTTATHAPPQIPQTPIRDEFAVDARHVPLLVAA